MSAMRAKTHTFPCVSHAEWCAYENLRDGGQRVTKDAVRMEAADYLRNGLVTCICGDGPQVGYVSQSIIRTIGH